MQKYLLLLAAGSMVFCSAVEKAASPTNALISAVQDSNLSAAQKAIQDGADVNARSSTGESNGKGIPVLGYAINGDSVEIVRALIKAGAKVNVTTEQAVIGDEDPLIVDWVRWPEDTRSAEEIKKDKERIEKGKARNALNVPLISAAVIFGGFPRKAIFNELIKARPDVNARALGVEWTPLMIAAFHGNTEAVKGLLAAGADKTLKNPQDGNRTAIDYAKERGHEDIVALLQDQKPEQSFWSRIRSWFGG